MKNRMSDLRNHLFEALEALKDPDSPMDLDTARAISGVAQTIINSAKCEIEFLELTGQTPGGEFFDASRSEIQHARLESGKPLGSRLER